MNVALNIKSNKIRGTNDTIYKTNIKIVAHPILYIVFTL